MISAVEIRRATDATDIRTVADMWIRSAEWLRDRGLDQWQYPVRIDNIERTVAAGTCWVISHLSRPIATITLDSDADAYCWFPEDSPDDALYVHRMVVDLPARGSELGTALLDWAGHQTCRAGRSWLRLDAWTSNRRLHEYYLSRGFQLVRIVDHPEAPSGACFQRPAQLHLGHGPSIRKVEPNLG